MIGLDTNVLVRYLAQDDPDQAARATRILEEDLTETSPGFIGLVALVETVWVLQRPYKASAQEIRETVSDLVGCRNIVVENRHVVAQALALAEHPGCSFPDAMIAASRFVAGCQRVMSFDRGAVHAGMTLIA